MTKPKRSLADVVAQGRKSIECMLCNIPERKEIEEERRKGAELRHIVEYLIKDCGYPESDVSKQRASRMGKHFRFHSGDSK